MKNSSTGSGKVLGLYVSRKENAQRSSRSEIRVDENGVAEDKFYAKDPQRSILIAGIGSYQMAEEENIDMAHGSLGENILLDCNPYDIPVGTTFAIGSVFLEITQNCTLCKSLTKIDPRLPRLLRDDRGIFAKVVREGSISLGDPVRTDIIDE